MGRKLFAILLFCVAGFTAMGQNISGRVVDTSGAPLAGVYVSDGVQLVQTGKDGRYAMESAKTQDFVFVIAPSGYVPKAKDGIFPQFYHRLSAPVGEEEVHDFVLRAEKQDSYSLILMADVHLTGDGPDFRDDITCYKTTVAPFLSTLAQNLRTSHSGPVYCFNLGDLAHEVFWYRNNFNLQDACNLLTDTKFPCMMWSTPGNHDNDGAVTTSDTNYDAGYLFRRLLGPEHFALNIGGDHYIFMDNIEYHNTPTKPNAKTPGIKGKRNYIHAFTPAALEFLRNDLATLSPATRVYICCHADVITEPQKTGLSRASQADTLQALAQKFGHVQFYSGHAHRLKFVHGEGPYSALRDYSICALSGNMWTTKPQKALSLQGEDTGVMTVLVDRDTTIYRLETVDFGEKWLKVYDMNEVAKAYSKSSAAKKYFADEKNAGKGVDYSTLEGGNLAYINWWYQMPGYSMQVLENGVELQVEKVEQGDPMIFFNYTLPRVDGPFFGNLGHRSTHLYAVKRSAKDGVLTVRIKDENGKTLYEVSETFPKKFDIKKQ